VEYSSILNELGHLIMNIKQILFITLISIWTTSYANPGVGISGEWLFQQSSVQLIESDSETVERDVITTVSFSVSDDQKMVVTYYFNPIEEPNVYLISLEISTDGGNTYFAPKSLSGDFGKSCKPGRNIIEWDIFSDVDEIIGDVQVKVEAKVKRTVIQRVFVASKIKSEQTNGIGAYLSYPLLNFNNNVYREHLHDGILEAGLGIGIGMTLISLPFQVNADFLINNYEVPNKYSISHISGAVSVLFSPIPTVPYVTPFFGLGIQLSELADLDDSSRSITVNTSDLFAMGSATIVSSNTYFAQVSYKHSVIRKVRSWHQFQLNIGIKI